jgi:hypothetical protein
MVAVPRPKGETVEVSYRTYREAHDALMDADRNRSRTLNRVMDEQAGGRSRVDRMSNAAYERALARARRHPDYREANEAFDAISRYIREKFPTGERRANARLARDMGF